MKYDIQYIQRLISDEVEESLTLDYKASGSLSKSDGKKTEISKDVSALANANGGMIIYGISEFAEDEKKHLPEKVDPVNRQAYTKEWLEQIINSRISPRIDCIVIHPIELDESGVVYIVEVPQSNTAHQAYDKRYYKRFNFQSSPMEDYEIRDIMNRAQNPTIELEFELTRDFKQLNVFARNKGKVYAKYVNVYLKVWERFLAESKESFGTDIQQKIYADNTVRDFMGLEGHAPNFKERYGPSRYEPILPHQRLKIKTIDLGQYWSDEENVIEYEVYCDNAPPIKNQIMVKSLLN